MLWDVTWEAERQRLDEVKVLHATLGACDLVAVVRVEGHLLEWGGEGLLAVVALKSDKTGKVSDLVMNLEKTD